MRTKVIPLSAFFLISTKQPADRQVVFISLIFDYAFLALRVITNTTPESATIDKTAKAMFSPVAGLLLPVSVLMLPLPPPITVFS